MKELTKSISLPEGNFQANVLQFEEKDRATLYKIYIEWRNLCNNLNSLHGRGVNLPEGLSESSFCLEMGVVRTAESIKATGGAHTSFDAYDLSRKKRIQVKACSVLPDLTSFGPKSVWDEIYFVDFYRDGSWDGKFDIYLIDNQDIYNHKVNATETFKDQQKQGRRPRFSIYKDIIQVKKLAPIKTADLSK